MELYLNLMNFNTIITMDYKFKKKLDAVNIIINEIINEETFQIKMRYATLQTEDTVDSFEISFLVNDKKNAFTESEYRVTLTKYTHCCGVMLISDFHRARSSVELRDRKIKYALLIAVIIFIIFLRKGLVTFTFPDSQYERIWKTVDNFNKVCFNSNVSPEYFYNPNSGNTVLHWRFDLNQVFDSQALSSLIYTASDIQWEALLGYSKLQYNTQLDDNRKIVNFFVNKFKTIYQKL